METTSKVNRRWRLAARPVGLIKESDFALREEQVPTPKEGQVLIRNLYLSLDPTMRSWVSDVPTYFPPVPIGEVMWGTDNRRRGAVAKRPVSRRDNGNWFSRLARLRPFER